MYVSDTLLFVPLAITLLAAAIAALAGLPAVNRRLSSPMLGWVLALAPLAAFSLILSRLSMLEPGTALSYRLNWLPSLGLGAALYFDHLSALFALLVTGIGALVVIYAGYYFKGDPGAWRFFSYILLFKTAMLGVVLAGDVITLFIFWEATSITSFLLIA
jgi:NADH:ubiquinone oxidoreductase subunit 5 (subunit L)/multisubunit Na+/H+ antiporter MnhA subunit